MNTILDGSVESYPWIPALCSLRSLGRDESFAFT
jgi:hypothetical protein